MSSEAKTKPGSQQDTSTDNQPEKSKTTKEEAPVRQVKTRDVGVQTDLPDKIKDETAETSSQSKAH